MASEAVLYVRDLDGQAGFYSRALGLTLHETGDGYRGLRTSSFTVWLVQRSSKPGADAQHDAPMHRRSDVPVKLGFQVPSIAFTARTIESLGGRVSAKSWEFAGFLRRDIVDLEGNVLQLLEPIAPLHA